MLSVIVGRDRLTWLEPITIEWKYEVIIDDGSKCVVEVLNNDEFWRPSGRLDGFVGIENEYVGIIDDWIKGDVKILWEIIDEFRLSVRIGGCIDTEKEYIGVIGDGDKCVVLMDVFLVTLDECKMDVDCWLEEITSELSILVVGGYSDCNFESGDIVDDGNKNIVFVETFGLALDEKLLTFGSWLESVTMKVVGFVDSMWEYDDIVGDRNMGVDP